MCARSVAIIGVCPRTGARFRGGSGGWRLHGGRGSRHWSAEEGEGCAGVERDTRRAGQGCRDLLLLGARSARFVGRALFFWAFRALGVGPGVGDALRAWVGGLGSGVLGLLMRDGWARRRSVLVALRAVSLARSCSLGLRSGVGIVRRSRVARAAVWARWVMSCWRRASIRVKASSAAMTLGSFIQASSCSRVRSWWSQRSSGERSGSSSSRRRREESATLGLGSGVSGLGLWKRVSSVVSSSMGQLFALGVAAQGSGGGVSRFGGRGTGIVRGSFSRGVRGCGLCDDERALNSWTSWAWYAKRFVVAGSALVDEPAVVPGVQKHREGRRAGHLGGTGGGCGARGGQGFPWVLRKYAFVMLRQA